MPLHMLWSYLGNKWNRDKFRQKLSLSKLLPCIGTRFPVGLQAEQTPVVLLPRVVHSELEQLKTVENFFFLTFLTCTTWESVQMQLSIMIPLSCSVIILKFPLPRFLYKMIEDVKTWFASVLNIARCRQLFCCKRVVFVLLVIFRLSFWSNI